MDVFEALADPVRRAILRRLASGPARVVDIANEHAISRPAISRHLRVLGDAGLVRAEDRGRERHYRAAWGPLDEVRTFLAAVQARPPIPASALDAAAARSCFTRGVSMSPIPAGRHAVVDGADTVVFERYFAAPIDDVWAAITESDRLARWIGYYTGDPADGFVMLTMNAEDEPMTPSRCEIVVCEPPRLLRVRIVDAVGTWNLVATLSESAGVTTATLTQIISDPKMIENTGPGWEYYLDRLVAAQAGADPSTIDFADYYPAQRDYYLAIQETVIGSA